MSLAPLTPRGRRRLHTGGWALICLSAVLALDFASPRDARAGGWLPLRLPAVILGAVATAPTPNPIPSLPDKPIDFSTPGPAPTQTPYVAASATPEAKYPVSGGPVTLSLNGSATLGGRLNASSASSTQTGSTTAAGFFATLARRTPKSALRMTVPTGFVGTHTSFGELQAGFDAAHFSLSYAPQSLSSIGQLPLGGTVRGPGLTFPTRYGDALFFAGTAYADDNRGFNTRSARLRVLLSRGFAGAGLFDARAQDGQGRISGLTFGYATVPGRIDGTFEAAFERTRGLNTARDGTAFAYQMRGDYGTPTSYATIVVRNLPAGFAPLAPSLTNAESLQSLTFRTNPGALAITLDAALEKVGDASGITLDRRSSLSIGAPIGAHVSTTLFLNDERLTSLDQVQWNGNANLGAFWILPSLALQGTIQLGRATQNLSGPTSSMSYSLGASKFARGALLDFSYRASRDDLIGARNRTSNVRLGISRIRPRSATGLATTIARTQNGAVDQTVYAEILEVTRHLSPALTLTLDGALQLVRDHANSRNNGTSGVFSINFGTPFSIGNGALSGRIDPRLPVTITGVVVNDATTFSGANGALPSGVGGVNVVLDGRQTQRTDAQGRFEFRSVRPGRHEVAIDPASLPRGVTADQPYVDLNNLQGGQVAQLTVGVGAFGLIEGRVFGRDRSGTIFPIPDIPVIVDGQRDAHTTASGYYGIGRLAPGSHIVEIRPLSFPASLGLVDESKRTVLVHVGERVAVDFRAEPLGSITGRVVSDGNGGEPAGAGLANVYVVANPGDHAAITNDDGSYSIENLAPGTYTVAVDEETLRYPDTGVVAGPKDPIAVRVSETRDGVVFTVGHKDRPIDFTFGKNEVVGALALGRDVLPPGGSTMLTIGGISRDRTPAVRAFERSIAAVLNARRGSWQAQITVPANAQNGIAVIEVQAGDSTLQTKLRVDASLPIASFLLTPARPVRGQYVHVRAHFLTPIASGDRITWSDGTITRLSPARNGLLDFDVKLADIPYHGILSTGHGQIAVTLAR